ncbi:ATP-dependent Clp protease proteolytic subunit [Variovorax paradoxus]|uniref:ATP-dependent Clp protease proteolytic subunit n=1 Tax=Variovorax paradoxus TaxID=34073 RepID=UPI003D7C2C38
METDDDTTPAATAEPRNSYLEEKAFKSRTLLIFGSITDSVAADVTRRLIALDADSADKPIDILVSSPGGHLESGDAIHDIVRFISAPVNMIGTGWVGSAATHLYLAAPKERRVCLPNTRFLIHQPSGGAGGQATDIAIQAQEIIKARHRIAHEIARETGKPIDVVHQGQASHCARNRARNRQADRRGAGRHRARPLALGRGSGRIRPGLAHHPAQDRAAVIQRRW